MKIVEIKPSKLHLSELHLSNGTQVLLDKDVCCENSLAPDMEIDDETVESLKFQSDYVRAKSRALWYLDRMDYSEKALFDKLVSKGFDKKSSSAVIAKLVELGLLDDRRYGEYLAQKLTEAGNSKRAAMQKMYAKGVPYDLCKELLEETEVDEESSLLRLIEKKYAAKLEDKDNYQKVYAALVRRGFSYSAVKSALKKYTEDLDFSED
ncbi:MAG: regulatory protein RecX [Clostridia bacterium]|nr:regulatory protein RecX [Clostridia bacterium]